MNKSILGIYLRVYGYNPKYVIKSKIGPFHNCYDVFRPWEKIDIVKELIQKLDNEINEFLLKFEATDKKHYETSSHRVRRYISKERKSLYPTKDHVFTEMYSYSFKEYWIGTNIGASEITQYVREMCEACKIEFGYISKIKF